MTRRLTVVQVLPRLDGGGVERGTLEVGRALVEAGHRSIVVSGGGRMVNELVGQGSEHHQLDVGRKSPLTLRLVPVLRQFWEDEGAQIIHTRSRVPGWIAYLGWRGVAPTRRPRFVTTVHGAYSVNRYSAVMTYGERVIAVSKTIREYVLTNYPKTDPQRVVTILRGVDRSAFPSGFKPSSHWLASWYATHPELAGKQVLTLVGRLTRLKGHTDFLDVLKHLRASGRDVVGLFVGNASPSGQRYERELKARVAADALPVVFAGHRPDVREIYSVSDAVVSMSTKPESFGRSVLEALYLGRPVLGYNHGGVGEVLRAVYPQGAVTLGDIAAMSRAVAKILDSGAQVDVADPFPLQAMLDQTLTLYTELAHSTPTEARDQT